MADITQGQARQYATSEKLAARARLHQNYTIAEKPYWSWLADHFNVQAGQSVLDIGCGPAWFWSEFADRLPDNVNLTLSDLSQGMLDEAAERCRTLRLGTLKIQQADAASLPFPDQSFDSVIAMHMLYHVPEQQKAIEEFHRVLKPGGSAYVTTNGIDNLRELYQLSTVFGSQPHDPAAEAFGFDQAKRLLKAVFGNVTQHEHPAMVRITKPEDIFLALTSYPPGETASDEVLDAFRAAIDQAFARRNGVLESQKQVGLFKSTKLA